MSGVRAAVTVPTFESINVAGFFPQVALPKSRAPDRRSRQARVFVPQPIAALPHAPPRLLVTYPDSPGSRCQGYLFFDYPLFVHLRSTIQEPARYLNTNVGNIINIMSAFQLKRAVDFYSIISMKTNIILNSINFMGAFYIGTCAKNAQRQKRD